MRIYTIEICVEGDEPEPVVITNFVRQRLRTRTGRYAKDTDWRITTVLTGPMKIEEETP